MTNDVVECARDTLALEMFERLVQTQQPADTPWAPVTDYSFEARKAIEGMHPQLIADVFQPKRVLDVGCGPGHLVRLLLELDLDVHGFDINLPVPLLKILGDRLWRQDLLEWEGHENWDLVINRECLEHLTVRQIKTAVRHLCSRSSKFVYVTTRFAKAPMHLLDVDTSDDLDPTHITMLNQNFLRLLFVLEGFTRRADLETRMDWQHQGRCLVYERA